MVSSEARVVLGGLGTLVVVVVCSVVAGGLGTSVVVVGCGVVVVCGLGAPMVVVVCWSLWLVVSAGVWAVVCGAGGGRVGREKPGKLYG